MAVVTLLSDFIDGTSMALAEDTDAADLNAFMTANQGRLWASVQQRRRQRQALEHEIEDGLNAMPSYAEKLSEEEIMAVATYVEQRAELGWSRR